MNKCKKCTIGITMDAMERQWLVDEGLIDLSKDQYISLDMFKFCPFCGREIKENEKCIIT